ncbi:helix-turn-helix domain-containing protein [Actinophytocola sp.]|uniref:TetR/AcrR family transcriptional regulator n=1 Tax=Actinophytocola sp. TaxID=1872138 RepID=UPI002ED168FF
MSSAPDPEDLTARARIRDAAMRHFGEHGFERTTIRGIAETAGVSSGLVRHHFGSKEELRKACDDYVLRTVRKLNDETWAAMREGDLGKAAAVRRPSGAYHRYIARSLVDGGASELFDEMVRMSEAWLTAFPREGAESDVPLRDRAAIGTAWGLAIPIMFEHLSRAFGVDLSTPEGDVRLASALLDLYSHPLMSPEEAAAARAGLKGLRHD